MGKKGTHLFSLPARDKNNGTINDAAERIPIIKKMGLILFWMMPVMKNAYTIDNGGGPVTIMISTMLRRSMERTTIQRFCCQSARIRY